jgi:epoxide hydrolase-like predicted phosphatase
MTGVLVAAKRHGLRTALLSNSWGGDYERGDWAGLFDAVVISGEVGLRKPDPEIFRLTARRIGLPPRRCVFVDDLAANVRGAAAVGMVGVHHLDLESTVDELQVLFGLPFRAAEGAGPS